MSGLDRVAARRTVESLRSGVPSSAAIHSLGWADVGQVQKLKELLAKVTAGTAGGCGLLIKGDFGTGKSHLLAYLEQLALNENFVVSRIVISKETPLFKPDKVNAAAVRDGKVPGNRGAVLHELAPRIDFRGHLAEGLLNWAKRVPGMLAGSIHLMKHKVELGDDELIARIVDWWSGEKLAPTDVKTGLRKLGLQKDFEIRAIKAYEMADLRIALTSHIIRAAGFAGWAILLDELELIGRYSPLQRANSYAQLACWYGMGGEHTALPIVCVGTIAGDFVVRILDSGPDGRGDRDRLPALLTRRVRPGSAELAARAIKGMELIDSPRALYLVGPDDTILRHTHDRVLDVYRTAFDWTPPAAVPKFVATTTPMRTYIKTWIYNWDLIRLGVTSRPVIATETLNQSYEEDVALEQDEEGKGA